jgi:hypothetical protein
MEERSADVCTLLMLQQLVLTLLCGMGVYKTLLPTNARDTGGYAAMFGVDSVQM